jgi:hypothetical protein
VLDIKAVDARLYGLKPLVDSRTRVLVLGSFPGAASLAAQPYYAHPRNQFSPIVWSIGRASVCIVPNWPCWYTMAGPVSAMQHTAVRWVCRCCACHPPVRQMLLGLWHANKPHGQRRGFVAGTESAVCAALNSLW